MKDAKKRVNNKQKKTNAKTIERELYSSVKVAHNKIEDKLMID